jgi:ERCC4-type nuclease
MRLPTRRSAAGVLEVVVDSRERYAWKFEQQQVKLSKRALVVGDYAIDADGETVGVVERKKLEELAGNVVDGSLARDAR